MIEIVCFECGGELDMVDDCMGGCTKCGLFYLIEVTRMDKEDCQ